MFSLFKDIFCSKDLLTNLVKNDFKTRYLNSYLGSVWAFIQPVITILIFWFVFQVGFKSQDVSDIPFILWLITGMIPWFFLAEGIQSSTNSVIENAFLVKKIVFKVTLFPMIKIISALLIHIFFIFFMLCMFIYYGFYPNLFWLQLLYYLMSSLLFLMGLSWLFSSIVVFFRDLSQIVTIFIQFGFWITPIFWSVSILPEKYQVFFKMNPIYYITNGYRDSLIYNIPFWSKPQELVVFWSITIILLLLGSFTFKRLQSHFADVL